MPDPSPVRPLTMATVLASAAVLAASPAAAQQAATPPPDQPIGYARMSDAGWDAFATYLATPPPRAFAVGPDGAYGWSRAATLADAMRSAVDRCDAHAAAGCQVVGANRELVVGVDGDGLPAIVTLAERADAGGLAALRRVLSAGGGRAASLAATRPGQRR